MKQLTNGLIWLTTQMRCGVEMFFVISGYCIASSSISILRSGGTLREYFRRRFLRIFPTFWCAVIFSVLTALVIESITTGGLNWHSPLTNPGKMSVSQWFGCLTLSSTWLHYLTGEERLCFPNQAWSLCHEEQFYAVVGVLMLISGRRFFRMALAITIGIAVVNLFARLYGVPLRGFFFDEQWFIFAAGMGIYWSVTTATPRKAALFYTILIGAILGLISLTLIKPNIAGGAHPFASARVAGGLIFAVVLILLYRYDAQIAGIKQLNWLKSCGLMSYSIYLVHLYPGIMISQQLMIAGFNDNLSTIFICIPLNLAQAISLGYVLYVLVERRFLKLRLKAGPETLLAVVQSERSDAIQPSNPSPATLSFEVAREMIRAHERGQDSERNSESRKSA